MRFYIPILILFTAFFSCVEQEAPDLQSTLFPTFEEEPRYGPLSDYEVDRSDLKISEEYLYPNTYKGEKEIILFQTSSEIIAAHLDDYSIIWRRSRGDLPQASYPVYDYNGHLLFSDENYSHVIDANTGETLETISFKIDTLQSGRINSWRVANGLVYTLNTDYPTDTSYRFQIIEHDPEAQQWRVLFSIVQPRDFWFDYGFSRTLPSWELGYEATHESLIFPFYIHDHPNYDHGIYALHIDINSGEVNHQEIPVRFRAKFNIDKPIRYSKGLLTFWTTHPVFYHVEDEIIFWENMGGLQRILRNHLFLLRDKQCSLYNVITGDRVWSSECSRLNFNRGGVEINAEQTYFVLPREDRFSVYDISSGELFVDHFEENMSKRQMFFDKRGRLIRVSASGDLWIYELDFD